MLIVSAMIAISLVIGLCELRCHHPSACGAIHRHDGRRGHHPGPRPAVCQPPRRQDRSGVGVLLGGHARSSSIPGLVPLVVVGVAWFLLRRTVIGRHVLATGGNETIARLSGVRTRRDYVRLHALQCHGRDHRPLLFTSRMGSWRSSWADPTDDRFDLDSITAVLLGGTARWGQRRRDGHAGWCPDCVAAQQSIQPGKPQPVHTVDHQGTDRYRRCGGVCPAAVG